VNFCSGSQHFTAIGKSLNEAIGVGRVPSALLRRNVVTTIIYPGWAGRGLMQVECNVVLGSMAIIVIGLLAFGGGSFQQ
jgi:hypothetical protein